MKISGPLKSARSLADIGAAPDQRSMLLDPHEATADLSQLRVEFVPTGELLIEQSLP